MEAAGLPIQLAEPARNAGQAFLALVNILDIADRLVEQYADTRKAFFHAFVLDIVKAFLARIEQLEGIGYFVESIAADFTCHADQLALDELLRQDARMEMDICRAGHPVGELGQIVRATGQFQRAKATQFLCDAQQVYRFAGIVHFAHRTINVFVLVYIEMVFRQHFGYFTNLFLFK